MVESEQGHWHSGLHNPKPYGIFAFPAISEIKHLAKKLYFDMVWNKFAVRRGPNIML